MWISWGVLALVLGGVAWLWKALYGEAGGGMHCIGCGACAGTGKCVLKRRPEQKKEEKTGDLS